MSEVRKPPRPAAWGAPKGTCRFCGDPILKPDGSPDMRKNWHPADQKDCLERWRVANDPAFARLKVFARDFGVCSYCGADTKPPGECAGVVWEKVRMACSMKGPNGSLPWFPTLGDWEVEHELPLWLVDKSAPSALRYWGLGNLKTACPACHKRKTAAEAAMRAKGKRIRAAGGLLKKKESKRDKAQKKREPSGAPVRTLGSRPLRNR